MFECPTSEVEQFTWVVPISLHTLCLIDVLFFILVLKAGIIFWTFLISSSYFINSMDVTFFFFEIIFTLKRQKDIFTIERPVKQTIWIRIPGETEFCLISGLIKEKKRSPNYFFLFKYTLL